MKIHHYAREETDTFDEVNKVFNELRDEIVEDFDENVKKSKVVDEALTELSSRIAKLEKKVKELTPESPIATIPKPKKKAPQKKPIPKKAKKK